MARKRRQRGFSNHPSRQKRWRRLAADLPSDLDSCSTQDERDHFEQQENCARFSASDFCTSNLNKDHHFLDIIDERLDKLFLDEEFCFGEFDPTGLIDENPAVADFIASLACWGVKCRIKLAHFSLLLCLLRTHCCFKEIPKDARTIYKTPRSAVDVKVVHPGHYVHFGLQIGLTKLLDSLDFILPDIINLNINVDGVKIAQSGPSHMWPISCTISSVPELSHRVINVGLYHGTEKPSSFNDFMRPLVDEVNVLLTDGLTHNRRVLNIGKCLFVCDTPARAYAKGTKGHAAKNCCMRCLVVGENAVTLSECRRQVNPRGRTVFLNFNAPLRTNESFRQRFDPEHHNTVSILEELDIDMVDDLPLDAMHLVDEGVTKKLFCYWLEGEDYKLSNTAILSIGEYLSSISTFTPCDYARKARSIKYWKTFKATEWNQIAMVTGPVFLKPKLRTPNFKNFLDYHVALRILSSTELCTAENCNFAKQLLTRFVKNAAILYGDAFVCHNVHNLIHLADDVARIGPLKSFSTYVFENHIGELKKLINKSHKPLQQVAKRLIERDRLNVVTDSCWPSSSRELQLSMIHNDGPMLENIYGQQYKQAEFGFFSLRNNKSDGCIFTRNSDIILIENFVFNPEDGAFIIGRKFLAVQDLYSEPLNSSRLNIFRVEQLSGDLFKYSLEDVILKFYRIPIPANDGAFAVFPILLDETVTKT